MFVRAASSGGVTVVAREGTAATATATAVGGGAAAAKGGDNEGRGGACDGGAATATAAATVAEKVAMVAENVGEGGGDDDGGGGGGDGGGGEALVGLPELLGGPRTPHTTHIEPRAHPRRRRKEAPVWSRVHSASLAVRTKQGSVAAREHRDEAHFYRWVGWDGAINNVRRGASVASCACTRVCWCRRISTYIHAWRLARASRSRVG